MGDLFQVLAESETAVPRSSLDQAYGAALRLDTRRVAVNFVSTLDGVVSFGLGPADSRKVGGGVAADRLLMAMLRSLAGVIVVGAGTLRASPRHQWTPGELAPERTADLAALRVASGLPASPSPLLVVSATGTLPRGTAALDDPAVPVQLLGPGGLSPAGDVASAGVPRWWSAAEIVDAARSLAPGPILCEGGPRLFSTLVAGAVPLDLFLTVAPQLAGRGDAASGRRGLVEGMAFAPFDRRLELRSARRSSDHLLLRYSFGTVATEEGGTATGTNLPR